MLNTGDFTILESIVQIMEGSPKISIIIGLGNEGEEYAKTYHNVGAYLVSLFKHAHQSDAGPGHLRFISELPGYMNTIGGPVAQAMKFGNHKPAESLVVHDEADLAIGEFKLSFGGGFAGHKGVKSVIENLQTPDFWRLRIGIRDKNEQERQKAETFVLNRWSKAEEEIFREIAERAWGELVSRGLI